MTLPNGDRFLTLDTVRGVAVMGILLLNIVAFAMPDPAYYNPAAFGGSTGADFIVWLVNFVLFDGKMRGLFSFLFGASMLLVIDRAQAKGENTARVHYSRMVWLLVFGLLHMWLIWWGDILAQYALIGMAAFLFRDFPVAKLLSLGVSLLVVQLAVAMSLPILVLQAEAAPSDPDLSEALFGLQLSFGTPGKAWLAEQVALHRGSWLQMAIDRFADASSLPFVGLLQYGWETLAYMLFGMAALRGGMLTGNWERARYVRWATIGLGISLPIYAALAAWMVASGFSLFAVTTAAMTATVPVRPLAVIGWASLIILLMRPSGMLTARLAAAGRVAFSNYLGTSMICTTIFYGYGLGWFGTLSRAQLYLIAAGIWALILLWSKPWLDRFAHGPFEWLWRNLAGARVEQIKRPTIANATQ